MLCHRILEQLKLPPFIPPSLLTSGPERKVDMFDKQGPARDTTRQHPLSQRWLEPLVLQATQPPAKLSLCLHVAGGATPALLAKFITNGTKKPTSWAILHGSGGSVGSWPARFCRSVTETQIPKTGPTTWTRHTFLSIP
ncbi:hypothetical protein DL546_008229 [Coniochaeta pulveracea]|uniref:Uncharacterized protein n=1 Tax=Coniochaeta pulveracea TaxID=177199 RepID=A0A420YDD1_9PEZI|nr:hypothetical protein DL546_008229 [Coniochaeta pulveracea]